MKRIIYGSISGFFRIAPRLFVKIFFGNIWKLRRFYHDHRGGGIYNKTVSVIAYLLADRYWETYGSYVGSNAIIEEPPVFPHGPMGIFISNNAHLGRGCVIFQQVTIGSNTIKDSKRQGSPYLEDNVYIGCGAKLIGKIHVGRNARIGANCVCVKDVPGNSVTIIRCIESIVKDHELDNEFVRP